MISTSLCFVSEWYSIFWTYCIFNSFASWWKFGLFLILGYYGSCCCYEVLLNGHLFSIFFAVGSDCRQHSESWSRGKRDRSWENTCTSSHKKVNGMSDPRAQTSWLASHNFVPFTQWPFQSEICVNLLRIFLPCGLEGCIGCAAISEQSIIVEVLSPLVEKLLLPKSNKPLEGNE